MTNNPKHLRPSLINIREIIEFYARNHENVTLIQVGANDGKTNDPFYQFITKYGWSGVLLEPQPTVFEESLTKTYSAYPQIKLENAAIADGADLSFYQISFSKKRWATGLSGFDRTSLERQIESGYVDRKASQNNETPPGNREDYIEEVRVSTTTFEALLSKYELKNVNVLGIDTEGFDYEVLKSFPFEKIKPELVLFESKNLQNSDFIAAKKLLSDFGYSLFWQKGDTLAIQFEIPTIKRYLSCLRAMWEKL